MQGWKEKVYITCSARWANWYIPEQTITNKAGIYFSGVVAERRKRMVPKDNPETEVVTYTFYDDESRASYYVDDFAPDSYLEVGEYVELPIRIKAYNNKTTGKPAYSMTIRKTYERKASSNGNGEVFWKVSIAL